GAARGARAQQPRCEDQTARGGLRHARDVPRRRRAAVEHRLRSARRARLRTRRPRAGRRARADAVTGRSGQRPCHLSLPADLPAEPQARAPEMVGPPVNDDPLIKQPRRQISDTDRSIVDAFNARLRLVARLKSYKESRGIDFLDPEREEWMLQYLTRANRGPLSQDGLKELFDEVLDLTKREVQRGEES